MRGSQRQFVPGGSSSETVVNPEPQPAGFVETCGNSPRPGRTPKLSSILSPGPVGFAEACGNSPRPG
eukprot:12279567-Alexandrium_andersonii.AAC.1